MDGSVYAHRDWYRKDVNVLSGIIPIGFSYEIRELDRLRYGNAIPSYLKGLRTNESLKINTKAYNTSRSLFDETQVCTGALPLFGHSWAHIPCNSMFDNVHFICEKSILNSSSNEGKTTLQRSNTSCPRNTTLVNGTCFSLSVSNEEYSIFDCAVLEKETSFFQDGEYEFSISKHVQLHVLSRFTLGVEQEVTICSLRESSMENCIVATHLSLETQERKQWYCTEKNCSSTSQYLVATSPVNNIVTQCDHTNYECMDRTCILQHPMCDGEEDCPDGSDEMQCDHVCAMIPQGFQNVSCYSDCHPCNCSCHPLYFQCTSGGCIPGTLWCDAKQQCRDGSDEQDCIYTNPITSDILTCTFILSEDSRESESGICSEGCLRCSYDNFDCYAIDAICLLDRQENGDPKHCSNTEHLHFCEHHECPDHFKCPHDYCIPLFRVCDHVRDCPNGEDESSCKHLECPGLLKCQDDGICVHPNHVCDGEVNCPISGDDEALCKLLPCPSHCSCYGLAIKCTKVGRSLLFSWQSKILVLNKAEISLSSILFRGMTELMYIDMSYCALDILPIGLFIDLAKLQKLDLSKNSISILEEDHFRGLVSLKELHIIGNELTTVKSRAFSGLLAVSTLDLSNMNIFYVGESSFAEMAKLSEVNLAGNEITYIAGSTFKGLSEKFHKLDLKNNPLRVIDPAAFKYLKHLQWIATDESRFCCFAKHVRVCLPESTDLFFSCSDLIANSAISVVSWVITVVSGGLNGFAVHYNIQSHRSNKLATFIVNLSLADYFMVLYYLTLLMADLYYRNVYMMYQPEWIQSFVCKAASVISVTSIQMSLYTTFVIAMNQYFAIRGALKNQFLTFTKTWALLLGGWTISVTLSIVWVIFDEEAVRNSICLPFTSQSLFTSILVGTFVFIQLVIVVLIIIFYICLVKHVKDSSSKVRHSGGANTKLMLVKLVLIFAGSFSTVLMFSTVALAPLWSTYIHPQVYYWLVIITFPMNGLLNPILHTFLTRQFRNEYIFTSVFHKIISCGEKRDTKKQSSNHGH